MYQSCCRRMAATRVHSVRLYLDVVTSKLVSSPGRMLWQVFELARPDKAAQQRLKPEYDQNVEQQEQRVL